MTLPLGLPDLPFHLRIDPLAGFFLVLLGSVSAGISVYAAGYFREEASGRLALIGLQYHVFLASMAFVLLADDAYLFMVAWETMALSSYFLVITDHKLPAIRSAGFLYLLIAHLGAIAILLCFGVLHGGRGDYTFDALRAAELTPLWATVAFLLAFFGFGAKAGMIPLHAWLPEAHPAAPSPVSALMSGIMLKTAIYGMVRVIYDLIGNVRWEWGMVVLAIGAGTTLFGVLYALMQHDLKRLLAYHSVENIGIILLGLGMSMVFIGFGHPAAGALGLDRRALPHAQPRGVQGAVVPRRRLDPAFDGAAQPERHGRADPQHAQDRVLFPHRRARHLGAAAAERVRFGMAHLPGRAAGDDPPERGRAQPAAAFRRDARPRRRAHRDVLRQGLRHRLSRPAARAGAPRRRCRTPATQAVWNATAWPGSPQAASCSGSFRAHSC